MCSVQRAVLINGGKQMKRGDLVCWKYRMECGIPNEFGIILAHLTMKHDRFPYWTVLFGNRGTLQCRESDLAVVK